MLLIDYVFSIVKPPGSLPTAGVSAWRIILQAIHPATEIQTKPHLAERTHIVTFANQTEIGWPHSELIAAMLGGFREVYFSKTQREGHLIAYFHETLSILGKPTHVISLTNISQHVIS